jgi:hypothetical protein
MSARMRLRDYAPGNSLASGHDDATLIEKVDLSSNANPDQVMPPNKGNAKNTN